MFISTLLWTFVNLAACSRTIQAVYWDAGTSVALNEEKKGNLQKAETELRVALARATRELNEEMVASSHHNLGAFYRRQERLPEALKYLNEALILEEKVSGPMSERTGRTLAELSAAYAMENNLFEGRPFAKRLEPLAGLYKANESLFVKQVLEFYKIDIEKYDREVAKLKPLADAGDPIANYQLALVYFNGPDAKELIPQILTLYEVAANQGYSDAQYVLGVMYDKGRGMTADDQKSREWYRVAANNNHRIGQFNYAVFLLQGRGGARNETEAWEWIKKSSAQNYPGAQRLLEQNKK